MLEALKLLFLLACASGITYWLVKRSAKPLEDELERERMRLAALGYFDNCAEEYKSASLSDVLTLRAAYDAHLAGKPICEKCATPPPAAGYCFADGCPGYRPR
jgi:hypothetical protein